MFRLTISSSSFRVSTLSYFLTPRDTNRYIKENDKLAMAFIIISMRHIFMDCKMSNRHNDTVPYRSVGILFVRFAEHYIKNCCVRGDRLAIKSFQSCAMRSASKMARLHSQKFFWPDREMPTRCLLKSYHSCKVNKLFIAHTKLVISSNDLSFTILNLNNVGHACFAQRRNTWNVTTRMDIQN